LLRFKPEFYILFLHFFFQQIPISKNPLAGLAALGLAGALPGAAALNPAGTKHLTSTDSSVKTCIIYF
jgi:hypothetical protein